MADENPRQSLSAVGRSRPAVHRAGQWSAGRHRGQAPQRHMEGDGAAEAADSNF